MTLFLADLAADLFDSLFDVMPHRPMSSAPANLVDKIGDDFPAARRVGNFGMKLEAEKFPGAIFNRREFGIFRHGNRLEMARQFRELVAVRIPDLQLPGQIFEQGARRVLYRERALAIFAFPAFLDAAAKELRECLDPVANAQDGNPQAQKSSGRAAARRPHKRWQGRRTKSDRGV